MGLRFYIFSPGTAVDCKNDILVMLEIDRCIELNN